MMPRRVAALTSTLLYPTATLQTTLRSGHWASNRSSIMSVNRTIAPDFPCSFLTSWIGVKGTSRWFDSTSKLLLSRAKASSKTLRDTSTFGLTGASFRGASGQATGPRTSANVLMSPSNVKCFLGFGGFLMVPNAPEPLEVACAPPAPGRGAGRFGQDSSAIRHRRGVGLDTRQIAVVRRGVTWRETSVRGRTRVIQINGGQGEGGGQILRTALTLAAIRGVPVHVHDIRAGRRIPGLQPQHLTAVKALAAMCEAEVQGASLGSRGADVRAGPRPSWRVPL